MLHIKSLTSGGNVITAHATDDASHQRFRIDLDLEMLTDLASRAEASKGKKCREAGGALVIKHVGSES